jgi:hypothetical protein
MIKVPPLPRDPQIHNDEKYKRYFITRNPSIGKTYFVILLLVMLLQQGKMVLMDHEGFTLFINLNDNSFKVNSDEYKYGIIIRYVVYY